MWRAIHTDQHESLPGLAISVESYGLITWKINAWRPEKLRVEVYCDPAGVDVKQLESYPYIFLKRNARLKLVLTAT